MPTLGETTLCGCGLRLVFVAGKGSNIETDFDLFWVHDPIVPNDGHLPYFENTTLRAEGYSILLKGYTPEEEDDTNIMAHAKRELERWNGPGYDTDLDADFNARVLDVLRIFTSMGHSGLSASIFSFVCHELMEWRPITPLTNAADEWMQVADATANDDRYPNGMWQNTRRPDAFSGDGGATYKLLDESTWEDAQGMNLFFRKLLRRDTRYQVEGPLHTSQPHAIEPDPDTLIGHN